MARLTGPLAFTGKLDGISAFKRKGSNRVILRPRYGPSKKDVDTKPSYDNTRRVNKEFGGRSTAAKWIRDGYHPLKPIADSDNLSNLNALLLPIQQLDTETEYGKRSVILSLNRGLLEGFNLNKWHPFESVIQNPVDCTVLREELKALISVPALIKGVNFIPPTAHPFFRVVAALSIVPDLYYHQVRYRPIGNYEGFRPGVVKTAWKAVNTHSEGINLELTLPATPPNDHFSLVLSLGIEMGTAKSLSLIEGIKYAGCGKIMAVR
jgi:hypothetical protein